MQIKCEYCGSFINDYDEKCPYCDGVNNNLVRMVSDTPKTISELKQWYIDRQLPPEEVTRFFIGTDYPYPRAYGIYKDASNNFVVYKNKNDGSRAIRYKGSDEAYAVNELYMKLKEEILRQKALHQEGQSEATSKSSNGKMTTLALIGVGATTVCGYFIPDILCFLIPFMFISFPVCILVAGLVHKDDKAKQEKLLTKMIIVSLIIVLALGIGLSSLPNSGSGSYYQYDNQLYYESGSDWYVYDDLSSDYLPIPNPPAELRQNTDMYMWNKNDAWNGKDIRFENSSYYSNNFDSDYNWDGGDWDGGGDWDSDW